jgi:hypothetical protein
MSICFRAPTDHVFGKPDQDATDVHAQHCARAIGGCSTIACLVLEKIEGES